MSQADPCNLARFTTAQTGVLDHAVAEMAAGRKRTHWMWFVFPQVTGLGTSPMAERYAIRSAAEARAYLAHPARGPNLHRCVDALLTHDPLDPHAILGWPDDLKLQNGHDSTSSGPDEALARHSIRRSGTGT